MTKSLSKYLSQGYVRGVASSPGSERRPLVGLCSLGGGIGKSSRFITSFEGIIKGIEWAVTLPGLVIPLM